MSLRKLLLIFITASSLLFTASSAFCKAGDVKDYFPEISGFKNTETKKHVPDNLFEYINGAAELYNAYNFIDLNLKVFEASEDRVITIEIYRHNSKSDAFGIYSQERPYECEYLNIGVQANYIEGYLNFYQSNYYVKISSFNLGDKDRKLLSQTARAVSEKIGKDGTPPALLALFPDKNKMQNSEAYISKDFLGYSFFENAYKCSYSMEGNEYQIFIIEEKDSTSANDTLSEYLKAVKAPEDSMKKEIFELEDPYQGNMILGVKGRYISGIINPENLKIEKSILVNILSGLKQ